MRGKQITDKRGKARRRITPAHAGKTVHNGTSVRVRPDHPRACGENRISIVKTKPAIGSPPRMRGKLFISLLVLSRPRITPAHAGKTKQIISSRLYCADHPRACGENLNRRTSREEVTGSPPRMRGKPIVRSFTAPMIRITPAHAGKTKTLSAVRYVQADHPRACGENFIDTFSGRGLDGSPPRMRGKLKSISSSTVDLRITPAHAGKTKTQ
mgnify:CR=1 FL=1